MTNLSSRLNALSPKVEELMRISGTPELSLGVMHNGTQVFYASYGYRDAEERLPPTNETVLPVYSLTKVVTAAGIGILIEEKKARWDTLVKDGLPSFKINDDTLQNQLTLTDLLYHRSDMLWGDNLFTGTNNNVLVGEK